MSIRSPHARHPVTADEARRIVAEMTAKTSRKARMQFYRHATEGMGTYRPNVSEEAKTVYRAALERDLAN